MTDHSEFDDALDALAFCRAIRDQDRREAVTLLAPRESHQDYAYLCEALAAGVNTLLIMYQNLTRQLATDHPEVGIREWLPDEILDVWRNEVIARSTPADDFHIWPPNPDDDDDAGAAE